MSAFVINGEGVGDEVKEPKCCPFCGGPAEIDEQGVRQNETVAWVFIRCKRRCPIKPMASGSRATGYYEDDFSTYGYGKWINLRSNEEAIEEAYKDALRDWNTRY